MPEKLIVEMNLRKYKLLLLYTDKRMKKQPSRSPEQRELRYFMLLIPASRTGMAFNP